MYKPIWIGVFIIILSVWPNLGRSWGFFAHRLINQQAIYSLPLPIIPFFNYYSELIEQEAVAPDKRCYVDSLESPKHYIDLDDWELTEGESLMVSWNRASELYSVQKLRARGVVPWQIEHSYIQLREALSNLDLDRILRTASDLGHYLGDAHVPLHTTKNYNGQLTNQRGIHALWESRLPERFAKEYNLWVGKVWYIESIRDTAWAVIQESHSLVDSVLSLEKKLQKRFPSAKRQGMIYRNGQWIRTYSLAYIEAYHDALSGMVERRLRASIQRVSSAWYSAWVDAGKPDLSVLIGNSQERAVGRKVDTTWQPTKGILGRREWH